MAPTSRPQWQQATALITLGAGGIATGMSIVPKAPADLTTPASVPPITLLAMQHANAPSVGSDGMLRAAIVHMARHFLRLAQTRSPAEMEAMIWQYASTDGADHGPSCAAFASLTLELGSRIAGQGSWVTGGTSYPWPVHSWVDGRVDPNPASPGVISVLQDAQNHGRWHPLGDGYAPQPGDWVLFDGHVEVVTGYHDGVLHTIGGDSLPNMSVNAHEYPGALQDQGVAGFVDNGIGMSKGTTGGAQAAPGASGGPGNTAKRSPVSTAAAAGQQPEFAPRAIAAPATVPRSPFVQASRALLAQGARPGAGELRAPAPATRSTSGAAPGSPAAPATRAAADPQHPGGGSTGRAVSASTHAERPAGQRSGRPHRSAHIPATGLQPTRPHRAPPGQAAIPGLFKRAHKHDPRDASALPPYHRHDILPSNTSVPGTAAQQAFIKQVAVGAIDTQAKYGVPASVTIAQAIDESAWGQSVLATNDNNLFGIKGTGPAGSDVLPTQEVINGQVVNLSASFQAYRDISQSIDAHGRLLAQSSYYANAMSQRKDPNAFAQALTGVYATDPEYGAKLIQLMQTYKLYRFDRLAPQAQKAHATHHSSAGQAGTEQQQAGSVRQRHSPHPTSPGRHGTSRREDPGLIGNPVPVQPGPVLEPKPGQPAPIGNPVPVPIAAAPSPAHQPKPGHEAQSSGRGTGQPADAPHSGQTAVLYPGRSARPAPLAHPARPTDVARTPTAGTGSGPGVGPAAARPKGRASGPAADPSGSQPAAGDSKASPQTSPGAPPGLATGSADAAIPGVPHVSTPHAGRGHARRKVNRMRPAYRAGRFGQAPARAHQPSATAPGQPAAPEAAAPQSAAPQSATPQSAGPQSATPQSGTPQSAAPQSPTVQGIAPSMQPTHANVPSPTPDGAIPAPTPHSPVLADAPTASQTAGAAIPGAGHHFPNVNVTAGSPSAAQGAWDHTPVATAPAGGSSIPGAMSATLGGSTAPTATSRTPATNPARPRSASGNRVGPIGQAPGAGYQAAPAGHPAAAGQAPASRRAGRQGQSGSPPSNWHAASGSRPPVSRGSAPATGAPASPASATGAPARATPARATPVGATPVGASPASATPVGATPVGASPAAANPLPTAAGAPAPGGADVPGVAQGMPPTAPAGLHAPNPAASSASPSGRAGGSPAAYRSTPVSNAAPAASTTLTAYQAHMTPSVRQAFVTSAKMPLLRGEQLYRDVASHTGLRWELLAACDWMQCKARRGYSPVYGEKLGTLNPDDTCYRTKSAALEQCASDLVQLARSVYQLDIATSRELTIRDLANVFAAFRWGGLLRQHNTSAMDFPYSVAGLTADHAHMRWPNIDDPHAPDKPGGRFRQPFGAVPVVLGLNYQALM